MKKSVIIILAILPFFLLMTISFAGRIVAKVTHVPVERVAFVDDNGEELADDFVLRLNIGDSAEVGFDIFPKVANNKQVNFSSSDESIATISSDGVVTAVSTGNVIITITTVDSQKRDTLYVRVVNTVISSVDIPDVEKNMIIGQRATLTYTVLPNGADSRVTWQSSDPSVATVNANGEVRAVSEGTAIITVTTVTGGLTDSVTVNVTDGDLPIKFDFSANPEVTARETVWAITSQSIDLSAHIKLQEDIGTLDGVVYSIISGGSYASLEGGVLTFTTESTKLVTVSASIGDHMATVTFLINPPQEQ